MSKALLIIDMLNDFAHPKGKLYCKTAKKVIPKIKHVRYKAEEKKIPVLFISDSHFADDAEFELWGEHAMIGTWGALPIDGLFPTLNDHIVKKQFYGGFTQTNLDGTLKSLDIDTLIVTGMHTHICVRHTCYDAFVRGYKIIVVSDATGTFTDEQQELALKYLKDMYGAKIVSSKEVFK